MPRRRIKKAKIGFISLVPKGANRLPVIYKADDNTVEFQMLVKDAGDDFMEKGELTAIVYAPEVRDSQGDIASAEVIKDMAHEAQRDGLNIDIRHDGAAVAKDAAFVAESFIVQKGDPRFEGIKTYAGETVDPVGSWGVVLKIDDPALRAKYRDGEWNGVSMGGTAELVAEKSDNMAERVIEAMAKRLGVETDDNHGDIDMKPEELTAALEKSNEGLVAGIVSGVVKGVGELLKAKPDETTEKPTNKETDEKPKRRTPPAPVFKGSLLNADDIEAHQRALALWELRKDVDPTDMDSLNEYVEKMGEFEQAFGELTDADRAYLEGKPVRKTGAPSTVPPRRGTDNDNGASFENVDKEAAECGDIGVEMAKWCNEQRGFAKTG